MLWPPSFATDIGGRMKMPILLTHFDTQNHTTPYTIPCNIPKYRERAAAAAAHIYVIHQSVCVCVCV